MNCDRIFETIGQHQDEFLDFLCGICSFEARAYDIDVMNAQVDYITAFAQKHGLSVTRTPMEKCGDFLTVEINAGAPKAGLFMAHMDTVHPKGSFGEPPVKVCEDRIIAPGAIDCKGGIAVSLLAMKALLDNGFDKHVRLILTSDEEVSNILGGEKEIRFIQESAAGFPCVLNCETAENDQVVIARKGILKYKLEIKGIGGHSGKNYFTSKNAVLEAAYKIIALHVKSVEDGTTYSCNVISGGTATNSIPDRCTVQVDIRAVTLADMDEVKKTVAEVAARSFIGGTTCEATLLSCRPPMPRNDETQALFDALLAVCKKHGLGSLTPIESGGGSDACYTLMAGVPSICGVGASGQYLHTTNEYVRKETVALRAKILAAFLSETK